MIEQRTSRKGVTMGTRGHFGFIIDGQRKIAYNHWDSYPGALGVKILTWLRNALAVNADVLPIRVRNLRVVDPNSEPTDEDIEQLSRFWNHNVADTSRDRPEWYQLLHGTQGDPAAILSAGAMEDGSGYGGAEWRYVVNFDAQTFTGEDLYEEAIKTSWPLSALPTDDELVKALEGAA